MSSLPNEIFFDISNFLPNDDITDLMLMSRTFNALVTPRLQKINQEMTTMNQSIESFMPTPAPHHTDNDWIAQLNLKKFEPIGSEAGAAREPARARSNPTARKTGTRTVHHLDNSSPATIHHLRQFITCDNSSPATIHHLDNSSPATIHHP
ncbi:hypothetical protein DdX_18675 [Ditylenchus destructor]|uniref:F-box domain-containing protein n=1 Tax=Ditylenchus destructor TaxID=166010 RepID=A0AAD4QXV7_9BILA|nr:hypothetical protein DdX_18675 [Ditylenchus destructor]